jgi:predicted phosphodiesterase
MDITRVLVLPDVHIPVEDKKTMAAVEAYMADLQPDEIIYLGDFVNFDCISSHNEKNLRAVEGKRIMQEINAANVVLDRHEALTPHTKRRTFLTGNHSNRLNRWVDAHPVTEDLLSLPKLLHFEERGYKFVPFWETGETHTICKATFIHGEYTSDGHAKATVNAYVENVFYGHTHDVQLYSANTKGDNKTRIGMSLGCLCKYAQGYMRGKPSRWQQAFGVFYFKPDGTFNHYVPFINKHRFVSPEGWYYDGSELLKAARQ